MDEHNFVAFCVKAIGSNNGSMTLSKLKENLLKRYKLRHGDIDRIITRHSNVFQVEPRETQNRQIKVTVSLEICDSHVSKNGACMNSSCGKLHICKFFLLSNSCKFESAKSGCHFGHDISSRHNWNIIQCLFLDQMTIPEIRKYLFKPDIRSTTLVPKVCVHYNKHSGCRNDENDRPCQYLHLCSHHVHGTCTYQSRCKRNHDINDDVKLILKKYGIDTRQSAKEILADLRRMVESEEMKTTFDNDGEVKNKDKRNGHHSKTVPETLNSPVKPRLRHTSLNDSDHHDVAEDQLEICRYFLRGKCSFKSQCTKHHKPMMYQWQFQVRQINQTWFDFNAASNIELEELYCDVEKSHMCVVNPQTGDGSKYVKVHYDKMEAELADPTEKMPIRRLSTLTSETRTLDPMTTSWTWYWQDQMGSWHEYGKKDTDGYSSSVTSSDVEGSYQESPLGKLFFTTSGHKYSMDFAKMNQTNIDYKTERKIRRRPHFVDAAEFKEKKTFKRVIKSGHVTQEAGADNQMHALIPNHWDVKSREPADLYNTYEKIQLTRDSKQTGVEFKKISDLFYESMPQSSKITAIDRIQNYELLVDFMNKRDRLKHRRKVETKEELLFHGTDTKYVDAICSQGFDWRMSGSRVGTLYGNGSYFAKQAAYSQSYTNDCQLFVVRVLVGDHVLGNPSLVRPPAKDPLDPFGDLYDCCVDNEADPKIFVIFTFDQVYPEYIIQYTK